MLNLNSISACGQRRSAFVNAWIHKFSEKAVIFLISVSIVQVIRLTTRQLVPKQSQRWNPKELFDSSFLSVSNRER